MSDEVKKAPSLDAARREKWKREALHGIELRTKRFGEFLRAVRELMAALPVCCAGYDICSEDDGCGARATWAVPGGYSDSGQMEYYCDVHAENRNRAWFALPHAPALRKLQAMLDPGEPT